MTDVKTLMKSVVILQQKIPSGHPLKSTCCLDIAAEIIRQDDRARVQLSQRRYASGLAVLRQVNSDSDIDLATGPIAGIIAVSSTRQIAPIREMVTLTEVEAFEPPRRQRLTSQQNGLDKVFSENERQQFVQRTARVLFTTEFAILVLYTKCIVPFVLATCTAAQYYLPNHNYYPQLKGVDDTNIQAKIGVVLILGVVQFVLLTHSSTTEPTLAGDLAGSSTRRPPDMVDSTSGGQ
ncbi:hypothetical protein PHYSODRAFT_298298 [Phytophthora sojae]|uniref:Uncharacterized protein n=1 Tax=Phytophthora sojae (strain P6497) TaxID=1094619 RepID=G4Z1X8_PHYSP|nr:hypothetical protein PHYSODRAFT_298298 [Phytophthora sojae]EGZ19976.1 hypothetical protein PHYSODRAFT_298298 [Phytophthora sojae]|eukprot:XP_009522693.1 hypothetical protein PHYSODRAFT_298298 [Phytophthora sojae]